MHSMQTASERIADVLIGHFGEQVLVDIGAGNGYFSMAAAARGHRVIAFELSNKSLASFEASVAYNGFEKMVTLHKVAFHTVRSLGYVVDRSPLQTPTLVSALLMPHRHGSLGSASIERFCMVGPDPVWPSLQRHAS